ADNHPLGCGEGPNRPNNVSCDGCETFSRCLYLNGAGPIGCPAPVSPVCEAPITGVTFPYNSLDDFQNMDEIGHMLDNYFHGEMHGDVADADGGGYNDDCSNPNCSTRDGMFWRLHKALDDVVRAWQDINAVDVTLVIDRSGSMSAASGTGVGSRMDNALEAADMFADLLEDGRSDGATNRIGIVSYSSTASNAALNLPLQDVDMNLRDPAGPFATTLAALSPGGATSIGAGLEEAVDQLCPTGSCATHIPAAGENTRKAVLLLTDGKENTAPCLEAGCDSGGGTEIDYATLDVTQLCAVGLGNAASINGELLTILAERQGGIYMNNTDSTGDDLKDFFAKCYAQLTDEFIGLDPKGVMATHDPASEIVPYTSCDDSRITFTSGWDRRDENGDALRLLVTTPDGDAWAPGIDYGEQSTERTWAFKRAPLPYRGQDTGTWSMQLLRPQRAFVNGFTTDAFADLDQGIAIVRRQIQRLCPIGAQGKISCERVLFFEDGTQGDSAYAHALKAEIGTTIGEAKEASQDDELRELLGAEAWDLIVYARQAGADRDWPSDRHLARRLCGKTRAIITDTRTTDGANAILRCAGATRGEQENLGFVVGARDFLATKAKLFNPGYPVFSHVVHPLPSDLLAATTAANYRDGASERKRGAIVGSALPGSELHWHMNVLVTGLTRLHAFPPQTVPRTGQTLQAGVRILPSFARRGGYPGGRMTVHVERPTKGLGGMVPRAEDIASTRDDPINFVEAQLGKMTIPTTRDVYELNDSGENGDLHANNGTYMAHLPINAAVDGMYTFHYIFDYPVGQCMARRELKQSVYVDVRVSPPHSNVRIGEPRQTRGATIVPVTLLPTDALGNVVGPQRSANVRCAKPCGCETKSVIDHLD
ncbi:MAG: vWA domain-containing protein, partial [Acidobacteriota bacterium]